MTAPTRRLISSGSRFEEQIGYSRAVVDGDHVWVSGTTGYDYAAMTIAEGVVEQAEQDGTGNEDLDGGQGKWVDADDMRMIEPQLQRQQRQPKTVMVRSQTQRMVHQRRRSKMLMARHRKRKMILRRILMSDWKRNWLY